MYFDYKDINEFDYSNVIVHWYLFYNKCGAIEPIMHRSFTNSLK